MNNYQKIENIPGIINIPSSAQEIFRNQDKIVNGHVDQDKKEIDDHCKYIEDSKDDEGKF
jgi:hypothetical protein